MDVLFNLMGYWGAVSLFSLLILLTPLVLLAIAIDMWVSNITNGEVESLIFDKINKIINTDSLRFSAPVVVSGVFSLLFFLVTTVEAKLKHLSYVQIVHNMSFSSAPFFSWLVSTTLTLIAIHFIAKKGYNISKAIKQLQNKCK